MARDVKINWLAVGNPYRGFISKFRQCLDEVYDAVLHSPKEKPTIRAQFEAFATAAGLPAATLPATAQRINSGQVVTPVVVTGTGTTATFTVAGGKVTTIALSA